MISHDPTPAPAPPPVQSVPPDGRPARRESPRALRRAGRFGGEFLRPPAQEPAAPPAPAATPQPADAALPELPGWVIERALPAGGQAELFLVRSAHSRPDSNDARAFVAKLFRLRSVGGTPWRAEEQEWRMIRAVVALRLLERAGCPRVPRVVTFSTRLGGPHGERRPWYVMPYYAGGAMWRPGDGSTADQWAEPYRGNVDRVLDIAGALATTLAAMHDGPRRVVHRDVTASNVFFAEPGGLPILGDFGIALVEGFAAHPGAGTWSNPWVWRPPELDDGDRYHIEPSGDVFMPGGLGYTALSGGRFLPPAREWDSASVHGRPAYTLRQYGDDARMTAVEALLGRMLTRRPADRLPAREVARVCRALRQLPRNRRGSGAR